MPDADPDADPDGDPSAPEPAPSNGAVEPDGPCLRPLPAERARDGGRDGIVLTDPLELCEPVFVPRPLVALLAHMDGTRSVAAIAAAAGRAVRQQIAVETVDRVVRDLDERLLLWSPRFEAARDRALQQFLAAGARPCRHAGSAGYPAEPAALRATLSAMVPEPAAVSPPVAGLIAPHIDLARGSPGYAAAYGRLLAAPPADLYVVLGTGHQGPSAPLVGLSLDWQTPLGRAPTDRAFVDAVHGAIGAPLPDDLLLHRGEHSLEFQVLLLQHVHERRGLPPPLVAGFLCGALPSSDGDPLRESWCRELLAALRAAARARSGRVCWVAGADLAHIGPTFGDAAPVDTARLRRLERDERARLQHLEQGEPGAFHRAIEGCGNPDRVCSAPAIALVAALADGRAELLHYGQACAEDGQQAVSFCAASFG